MTGVPRYCPMWYLAAAPNVRTQTTSRTAQVEDACSARSVVVQAFVAFLDFLRLPADIQTFGAVLKKGFSGFLLVARRIFYKGDLV